MSLKKIIGNRIKELRQKSNYTQAELSEKVGIASKHQSCIETGKNFPSAELLEKYAIAFEINVLDLLNITQTKSTIEMKTEIKTMLENANANDTQYIYKFCMSILK